MDIEANILISAIPLMGLQKYPLKIIGIFWDLKIQICINDKTQKMNIYKTVSQSAEQLHFFFPGNNSKTELCHGQFQHEKERKFGWYNWLATLQITQMRVRVEKVVMLIWNKSKPKSFEWSTVYLIAQYNSSFKSNNLKKLKIGKT